MTVGWFSVGDDHNLNERTELLKTEVMHLGLYRLYEQGFEFKSNLNFTLPYDIEPRPHAFEFDGRR